jgi:hypothetical protein
MTIDNFCFYLQNRIIQISQTGGQWYSDTFPFSIPWLKSLLPFFGCKGTFAVLKDLEGIFIKIFSEIKNIHYVQHSSLSFPSFAKTCKIKLFY